MLAEWEAVTKRRRFLLFPPKTLFALWDAFIRFGNIIRGHPSIFIWIGDLGFSGAQTEKAYTFAFASLGLRDAGRKQHNAENNCPHASPP